jgi:hexosaminidase
MTDEFVLLPMPQRLHRLEGSHRLHPERFIWLKGDTSDALLRTGWILQEALASVGPRWELTAAPGEDVSRLGAIVHVDPAQVPWPEGYRLTISADRIHIAAHDAAGAFYAAMTVRQLTRQSVGAGALPCLCIEDWPDFPHRGVMLDISRDKVPTMETLYALADLLAEWRINQFQLYTEHTFAYRHHREVWEKASPMTGEQVMALDAYCRQRFIELVPNQNSFGHLHRWLKHPRYRHLAEIPDGFEHPWGNEPFSLCPLEPGSLELLAELYDELLPHFSSRQFNVGCDETFDLGQGRSRAACEERGVGRVYLEFLLKIHQLVQRYGRTMQFWGDIIMHYPDLIPELPKDIIALEWGYEADHPFAKDSQKFEQAGVPYYVCPGTSSWNAIAGRTANALGNLWNAAESGRAHGAIGYLTTDWGDHGHWQHLPISFLGYAYGAAVSWASQANRDLDLPRVLDLHAFQDAAGVMGCLAYDLGNAYREAGVLVPNASLLALFLLRPDQPLVEGDWPGLTVEGLERTLEYVDGVMAPLSQACPEHSRRARMAHPDAELIADEFRNAAAMLRHACRLGIARLLTASGDIASIPVETRRALTSELEEIMSEYRRLWLSRNRPGGLADSVGRMERLLAMYQIE